MNIVAEKWDEIIHKLKIEYGLSNVSFRTWIEPLEVYNVSDSTVYILVPLKSSVDYINQKYLLPFQVCIAEITGQEFEVKFITVDDSQNINVKNQDDTYKKNATQNSIFEQANLNPKYTFDTFVVGGNNNFAHAASLAVSESPGEIYNPLFLYGGVGLGKTHLMHSIAHFILEKDPTKKVLYVTSETFTNELIEALKSGKTSGGNELAMTAFREKYRNIDVLLIDDVQFIIGKESTQEEFFHTFNELYLAKKQIVISSDKPPKDMETLEERIRSRFECGLTADIGSPDYETRMAILRRKEEMDNFHLDDEILKYIATNIKSNIRELEGALNKLLAYSNLEQTEITMEVAMKELQNIISPDKPREITPQLIIDVVCEHFHITKEQMISKSRSNDIAKPRQIAMYLCKNMTGVSLENIGELLGGRDHSTVIHGINKVEAELQTNEATVNLLNTIKKKINPN